MAIADAERGGSCLDGFTQQSADQRSRGAEVEVAADLGSGLRTFFSYAYNDAELLDFCGPIEVFSVADRQSEQPAFNVFVVAEEQQAITTRNGLSVVPHYMLTDCPSPDMRLVPGGIGTRREIRRVYRIRHRIRPPPRASATR